MRATLRQPCLLIEALQDDPAALGAGHRAAGDELAVQDGDRLDDERVRARVAVAHPAAGLRQDLGDRGAAGAGRRERRAGAHRPRTPSGTRRRARRDRVGIQAWGDGGLRGELTGSRFPSATTSDEVDSPRRSGVHPVRSGSPAHRTRTSGDSAGDEVTAFIVVVTADFAAGECCPIDQDSSRGCVGYGLGSRSSIDCSVWRPTVSPICASSAAAWIVVLMSSAPADARRLVGARVRRGVPGGRDLAPRCARAGGSASRGRAWRRRAARAAGFAARRACRSRFAARACAPRRLRACRRGRRRGAVSLAALGAAAHGSRAG